MQTSRRPRELDAVIGKFLTCYVLRPTQLPILSWTEHGKICTVVVGSAANRQ